MQIGELTRRSGLSVRTLRFYADAGVLPEERRTAAGYRVFGPAAVARGRLIRTLRELGVALPDVVRVLSAESPLADVAAEHAAAIDVQIRTLRLQRAVLQAIAKTNELEGLERMTDLTTMTGEERRRILEDYLDAVFGDDQNPVAERLRTGAPQLPEDPTPDQIAAWVELAALLRDPDYIELSRRMAQRAPQGAASAFGHDVAAAIGQHATAAVTAGVDPTSVDARTVIERIEALTPDAVPDRVELADRIEMFTDRRIFRYWELVGIVNGWSQPPVDAGSAVAWEWYAAALRAHPHR